MKEGLGEVAFKKLQIIFLELAVTKLSYGTHN